MKTINLIFLSIVVCLSTVASNGAPGSLDPTFGANGQVVAAIGNVEAAQDLAIQADGKIVVAAATIGSDSTADFAVLRLNANGTVDTSFGAGGKAAISFDIGSNERAAAIAVQTDGKILVAGAAEFGSPGYDFAVARLNADGSLDTTFGTNGRVKIPVSAANDFLNDMVLQPDGKIVLVGFGFNQPNSDIAVVRLTASGSLDTGFNGSGKIVVPVGAGAANDFASSVILQPDGKIVVAGGDGGDFALLRFNPNGSFDASFDGDGKVTTPIGTQRDEARTVALQPDGRIIAGGFANSGSGNKATLVRYNPNGSLDTTFDGDGKLTVEFRANESEQIKTIIIQSDGRIITVGAGGDGISRGDFILGRFNSDGSFDTSFGTGGKVVARIGTGDNAAYTAIAQPDGKIVAAGIGANGANSGFAVARFLVDSVTRAAKAFDYDGDKRADISLFRPSDRVWYIQNSGGGVSFTQFGLATDRIAPADYDGDGKTDIAVFRPETGVWFIAKSTGGFLFVQFGTSEDLPQPGDFNGDGKAEVAVYRPSTGVWFILNTDTFVSTATQYGASEDKPVAADYDGDGKTEIAVYRPSLGVWFLLNQTTGQTNATRFGLSTDKPVQADYDGDGKTDIAVYRPSEGNWYVLPSTGGFTVTKFGLATDLPTPADYDGDGKTDFAIYRASEGNWYLLRSRDGFVVTRFGSAEDKPAPGAFIY